MASSRLRANKAGIALAISANSTRRATFISKDERKKSIVTPAGMNVYPEDLEAALRRQPEVKEALRRAFAARDGNAEPCAVLILRDGVERSGSRRCGAPMNRWRNISACGMVRLAGRRLSPDLNPKTAHQSDSASRAKPSRHAGQASSSVLGQMILSISGRAPCSFSG